MFRSGHRTAARSVFGTCQLFTSRPNASHYLAGGRLECNRALGAVAQRLICVRGWPLRLEAANSLPSITSLCRVRVSPHGISDIPLSRFPYFSPELKHLAPLGRRNPLHCLVKTRRNIELDNPCHSILRCVFSTTWGKAIQMPELR